jgi:hypothetical protein
MKFLLKTAPAAVVSLTLLGGAAYSDAGFAFGASNGEKLSAQTISDRSDRPRRRPGRVDRGDHRQQFR